MNLTHRHRRERWLLLLAALLVAALLVWSRLAQRAAVLATESERLAMQARAVEQNLTRQLHGIRAALNGLREDLPDWPAADRGRVASLRLDALRETMPGVALMQWLDAQGQVQASSRKSTLGNDESASAWFLAARQRPDPAVLQVSVPFKSAAGVYALNLSLPIASAPGVLDGVVTATLDPSFFDTILASVLYAPDMWSAIVHGQGMVLVVNPGNERTQGINIARPGTLFSRHRDSGQAASVQHGRSVGTGDDRLVAHRTLQPADLPMDQPLVLAVSRLDDALLAPWLRQTELLAGLYLVVLAGAVLGLYTLQRQRVERQALADALHAREAAEAERLRLALHGGDLALWDANLKTGQGTTNERWSSMLGYAPHEISAEDDAWSRLLHPDDRERVLAAQQAHIEGRTDNFEATYRLQHRDGHWVWVLDRGRVVERDADGVPTRMVGTHLDISQRMAAEETLRQSEESLSITLQSIGDAVIATDAAGRITRVNDATRRLTGWAGDSAIGQPLTTVFRILNAQTREPELDPVARVLASGDTVGLANGTVLVARDGSERQIADSAAPIRAADGRVMGVVLVFSDVTEQYAMVQALRHSESRLRMAGRLARLGGWRVELPSGLVWLAAEAAAIVEAEVGKPLFFNPDSRNIAQADRARLTQALRAGVPFGMQIGVTTLSGRPITVRLLGEPVLGPNGQVLAMQGAMQDVTDSVRGEQERLALEGQLREAQKIESIGTLAGGIAHDFNNILAAILGNVALAREDLPAGHAALASLEQIHTAGIRARSLVQQILTFSRRQPQALVAQPLQPVVEETLSLLRATLPATVQLHTALAERPLRVQFDATQVQQVVMNLCTNAWHALPEGRGRIEVGLALLDEADAAALGPGELPALPCAHLWVADNGSGMDAATRQRVFDPFFTTKPVGQGTGLGLSVVHGIVKSHHGSILVDSAPGAGSTFHVLLPLAAPALRAGDGLPAAADATAGAGRHVLVVDDDEVMALMAQRLLQRAGWQVTRCSSAPQALALVHATPAQFDIIVTDHNMPEMSGTELAAQLVRLWPALPVVISSGYITDELRRQAAAAGVRALLQKEQTLESLAGLVHQVLEDMG